MWGVCTGWCAEAAMDMDMFEEGTGLSSAFSFLDLVLASSDCKTSAHVWTVSPHHRRLSSPPSCQVATNVFNEMYIPLLHKYVPPMGSCPMPLLALGERLRLMPRGLGCESRLGAMVDAIWHDGVSALATDAVRAGVWHGRAATAWWAVASQDASHGSDRWRKCLPGAFRAAGLIVPDSSMTPRCNVGNASELRCDTASITSRYLA